MKEKIIKIIFGYVPGFITGIIICGSISVIAATYFPSNDVTYDNKTSGLTSTNVQGAIDELYGVCTAEPPAGDQIIEDAGLEKDPYECRYFFTGGNPNNYVTFNNEDAGWRIVSVECDGTIKIMRNESASNMVWDSSGSNNWTRPASLNTYLNGTYYSGLSSTAQSQIVAKDWSIGAVTFENNNLDTQIDNENGTKWNGKVALVTASEYIRSNSNKSSCGTITLNDINYSTCKNTTWMYDNTSLWTLSSKVGDYTSVLYVYPYGFAISHANNSRTVRPALYLSSDVTLTGSGTQSDPYVVSS